MEPFLNIANGSPPLTILGNSSIVAVCLGSK